MTSASLPSAFCGSIPPSVPAAIPGRREEAGARRAMLSHRQAGGADRRGPAGGSGRAAAGACPALPARRTAPSFGRLF